MANKTYISPQQAYHDINMGDAGVAKINLKTGLASAVIPLANLPGNHIPINLELVFNGGQINDFHMGYGFKLGCMQKLVYNSADESLTYIDAGMCEHVFKKQRHNDKTFWAETSGMGLTVEIEYNNYVMYDSSGSKYYFDNGILNAISNKNGYFLRFAYTNNKMTKVIDDMGKTADLIYGNDGNVSKITIGEYIITFEYDDNKLTTLSIPGKGAISFTYSQGSVPVPGVAAYQNIAYYLTSVVNPCGQEYTFTLNANKVVQEVKMCSHHKTIPVNASQNITDFIDKHTLQYVNDYTTLVTNNKGITYTYSMDENGSLLSCWEGSENNFSGDIHYKSPGQNTIKLNTVIPYSTSYLINTTTVGPSSQDIELNCYNGNNVANFKNKMIVVSAFVKVSQSNATTGLGALTLKITSASSGEESVNAFYQIGNHEWQFVATAIYVPNDCTSITITAKCIDTTAIISKLRMQSTTATASQQVIYLADNNDQISKVCPISKIEQVKYVYDDIILEPGDYQIQQKTEYKNINQFYASDIQNLLSQYGIYKVVSCLGGRFKQSRVREIYFKLGNNYYPLNFSTSVFGSVTYSQSGTVYTDTYNLKKDPINQQTQEEYYIHVSKTPLAAQNSQEYIEYRYNNKNRLIKETTSYGIVTEYEYNNQGSCTKIKAYDKSDVSKYFEQSYVYEGYDNKLSKEYDTQGNYVQNYYDSIGHADAFVDANGNRTEYCVTPNDMMLKCMCINTQNNGLIHTHYGYNNGLLTNVTNNTGGFTFTYSGDGSINKVEVDSIRDLGEPNYKPLLTATKERSTNEDMATVEFANGYVAKTVLDKYGRVKETFDNGVSKTENKYEDNKLDTHIDNYTDTTVKYTYDSCGELQQVTETTTDNTLVSQVKTTKNADNLPYTNEVTFANNSVVKNTYSYNNNKLDPRLIGETVTFGGIERANLSYSYDNFGRIESINAPDTKSFEYKILDDGVHLTNQIKKVTYGDDSCDEYEYDGNGNITKITNSQGTTRYTYDSLNRLISETNPVFGTTSYAYDTNGNILTKTKGGNVTNYLYTNPWKDQLTSIGGQVITYDDIGNPTTYKGNTLYWTRGRMLERFGNKACYTYNSAGIRTEKCIQGVPTKYVISGSTILSETTNGSTTVYYYSADGVIGFNRGGANYFYRKNIQGDVIAIINSVGSTIVKYVYDAWGNHKAYNATGSVIYDSTNPNAYTSYTNHVGYINPFRYRGYYYDVETGLAMVGQRYYSPELCRFIQPADVSTLNPHSINGLNLYCYANNNPVGIAYNNSSVRGTTSSGYVNTIRSSMGNSIINNSSYNNYVDLNFLGNFFAFNENIYSSIAGVFEGIRRKQGLGQYESLAKASKILMHVGYWLNVGLGAYNNYHDSSLTAQEKWVSFGVDTVYTTGVTVGAYFLGMIPYAGPFLAILFTIGVEYLWSGELSIFGFDIDVQPIKINGKTIEEWVKYWVNSWFE